MKSLRKSHIIAFWGGLLLFLLPLTLMANEKVERLSKGAIDWSNRQLKVVAKASPYPDPESALEARSGAELSAKQKAWRAYIEMLGSIRLNANQTVLAYLEENSQLKYKVRGILRNFRQSGVKFGQDNSAEVSTYMPIEGAFSWILYSKMDLVPQGAVKIPAIKGAPSGIIIDARGTGLKPALLPKIRSLQGEVLFDTAASAALMENGPLVYIKEVTRKLAQKAGTNPWRVKALKSSGNYPVDIVLSAEDSQLLAETKRLRQLLAAGALVILVD